jgi:hypothetical protein
MWGVMDSLPFPIFLGAVLAVVYGINALSKRGKGNKKD